MKKSLFPDGGVWLKGNIHSHSTVSDGMFSPRELAELYRDHGYAFLSMTDHNVLVSHSELPEDQICLLYTSQFSIRSCRGPLAQLVRAAGS